LRREAWRLDGVRIGARVRVRIGAEHEVDAVASEENADEEADEDEEAAPEDFAVGACDDLDGLGNGEALERGRADLADRVVGFRIVGLGRGLVVGRRGRADRVLDAREADLAAPLADADARELARGLEERRALAGDPGHLGPVGFDLGFGRLSDLEVAHRAPK
jgi:hypothetical protein